ncbi:MAG: PsiF family protein [Georgfuchsia sp.]
MNRKIALVVASLFALAAAPAAMAGTQQEKMKTCNAEAKTKALKGDERKAFMKECLSSKKAAVASAKTTQQDKMKACNAEAKTKALTGDARKTFMSSCLSN